MAETLTKQNQSVIKTLRIIEILANSNQPMRLSDVAKLCEMPDSTTLRMLKTLVKEGYAYQEEGGARGYALTMRFTRIGQRIAERFSLRDVVHPYLLELSRDTDESCCLAIMDRGIVRYVDVVEGMKNVVRIRQRIGDSVPMHCTGTGKLFLTQYPPERLQSFMEKGLPRMTARTLINEDALRFELAETASRGYAIDNEECEEGMYCVACPIADVYGTIVAAVSVSGPITRMTQNRVKELILPKLRDCCRRIMVKVNGEE